MEPSTELVVEDWGVCAVQAGVLTGVVPHECAGVVLCECASGVDPSTELVVAGLGVEVL